jgi:hypothetical protein
VPHVPETTTPPHPSGRRRLLLRLAFVVTFLGVVLSPSKAPGTVQEQRQRLPPPAKCEEDDVAGYWKSHQYSPVYRDWVEFTLEIHRVPGSQTKLVGTILNHSWQGGPEKEQAGKCDGDSRWRMRIKMEGEGTYDKGELNFRALNWKLDQLICGEIPASMVYYLDNFTGKIDFDLQEFQSLNNDQGRSINEPTVFRRVGCLGDDIAPPSVDLEPPALFPEGMRGGGCTSPLRNLGCGC